MNVAEQEKVVAVQIPVALLQELDRLARAEYTSRSTLIRQACAALVKKVAA